MEWRSLHAPHHLRRGTLIACTFEQFTDSASGSTLLHFLRLLCPKKCVKNWHLCLSKKVFNITLTFEVTKDFSCHRPIVRMLPFEIPILNFRLHFTGFLILVPSIPLSS